MSIEWIPCNLRGAISMLVRMRLGCGLINEKKVFTKNRILFWKSIPLDLFQFLQNHVMKFCDRLLHNVCFILLLPNLG